MENNYSLNFIESKEQRNSFVIDNFEFYSFLNSWQRWEFQKLEGNQIFRLWIFDQQDKQIGQLLLIKIKAKRGTYFLSPHSPLIIWDYFEILQQTTKLLTDLAKKEKVSFVRICPTIPNTKEHLQKIKKTGFRFSPIHAHAEETHMLDLTLTEETLLQNLRKTTRYIVNRAPKEWVIVYEDSSTSNIEHFIEMHENHSRRTNWKSHYTAFSKDYIHNLFKVFDEWEIYCLNAKYQDFIEASLVNIKFGKSCVYYLGASEIRNPKFSPAYLVQWEAIKKAKNLGCDHYNFRGVSPDDNPKHPLAWVSLFKKWFGGYDYNLLHAHDYAFSAKYWITFAIEQLRAKKRWYYYVKPQH